MKGIQPKLGRAGGPLFAVLQESFKEHGLQLGLQRCA